MAKADTDIRQAILDHLEDTRSVAPREIAQVLAEEGEDWRKYLPRIRIEAVKLHADGLLVFIRKKKVVSPEGLKGVYRFSKPAADE
ncbi:MULTISPECIES: DUF3253 domain-containing protein [Kordiimonas]|jgi:hypothetical protein|uniref:DUF3253 domain-containing protein n=1 Tax=Kordiimonas TaxID=288021 RepID=UPI002580ED64|nr:DUF3253 domain-containing protein [Kordiimonas sp. UBA4487]